MAFRYLFVTERWVTPHGLPNRLEAPVGSVS